MGSVEPETNVIIFTDRVASGFSCEAEEPEPPLLRRAAEDRRLRVARASCSYFAKIGGTGRGLAGELA